MNDHDDHLEHALQLGCELTPTLGLQLADHHLLAVVARRFLVQETPGGCRLG